MKESEICAKNGDYEESFNNLLLLLLLLLLPMQIQNKLYKKGDGKRTENKLCLCKIFFQIKSFREELLLYTSFDKL